MTTKMPAAYVDPRDLGPASPLADLPRVFLQEQLDKGRSAPTLTKYERYLAEFVAFVERSAPKPKVRDVDLRTLKAYSSYLTRRQRRQASVGRRPVATVTKNLHLIALRGCSARRAPRPAGRVRKVETMKAPQPSPTRGTSRPRNQRMLGHRHGPPTACAPCLLGFLRHRLSRSGDRLDRAQLETTTTPRRRRTVRIADEITVLGKGNRHRRVYLTPRAREWVVHLRTPRHRRSFSRAKADCSMGVWSAERIVASARSAPVSEGVSHWLRHA